MVLGGVALEFLFLTSNPFNPFNKVIPTNKLQNKYIMFYFI